VHSFLCYDSAAADHDRLAVPAIFAEPARDLVARTGLPAAGRILDIGTGTGITARLAVEDVSLVVNENQRVPALMYFFFSA
jgi:hypothetical protein